MHFFLQIEFGKSLQSANYSRKPVCLTLIFTLLTVVKTVYLDKYYSIITFDLKKTKRSLLGGFALSATSLMSVLCR